MRHALEAVLVIALAVQAARLIWIVAAPSGPVGGAAPAAAPARAVDLGVLERFDPFFRDGVPATGVVVAADAAGGWKLFGVRADRRGGGSAILAGPDGKQASYGAGEEVAPGVVLAKVADDHVELRHSGRTEALYFPPSSAAAAVAAPPPAYLAKPAVEATPARPAVDPAALMSQLSLQPRTKDGRVDGVSVQSRGGETDVMQAAGLQPGDVILAVNGARIMSADRAAALASELAGAREAVIEYERGGQARTATLRMQP